MILNAGDAYEIGYAEFVHKQAHGTQIGKQMRGIAARARSQCFSMPWKKFSIAWKT